MPALQFTEHIIHVVVPWAQIQLTSLKACHKTEESATVISLYYFAVFLYCLGIKMVIKVHNFQRNNVTFPYKRSKVWTHTSTL